MAQVSPGNANEFIEQQLDGRLQAIEGLTASDTMTFTGPLLSGVDDLFRTVVESRRRRNPKRTKLTVILTTTGGYIEVVHRIVDTLRHHYVEVEFIIPNYAYSAGTVLAMSGDAIHMDYFSRLGPIDPQVETSAGRTVPALGYLVQYERLIRKAKDGKISAAEVQLLIDGFDQAALYQYEQARAMSIRLLKEWLAKYKFKNWKKTASRGKTVTTAMRTARAASIAKELNKTEKWHTHGHGISMAVLEKDLKLKINDFGAKPDWSNKIKSYYDLLDDYIGKLNTKGAFHIEGEYLPFM